MGSFLAIFSINNPKIVNSLKYNSLSYLGLLGIVISMYAFNSETPWPSYNALLPTISTAILIIFISKSTLLFRILSWKPLVVIGLISYSLYLWHYPLLSFSKYYLDAHPLFKIDEKYIFLAMSFISLILSYLSWKYIESPFRDRNIIKSNYLVLILIIFSSFILF